MHVAALRDCMLEELSKFVYYQQQTTACPSFLFDPTYENAVIGFGYRSEIVGPTECRRSGGRKIYC